MARGPLPKPNRRRRNVPTLKQTVLPACGPDGPAPALPEGYCVGSVGLAWWDWAWRLPQATKWDAGSLYSVARRALLEDQAADAVALRQGLLAAGEKAPDPPVVVWREMRELDKRLGLDPKGLLELRWSLSDGDADLEDDREGVGGVVRQLRPVDAA